MLLSEGGRRRCEVIVSRARFALEAGADVVVVRGGVGDVRLLLSWPGLRGKWEVDVVVRGSVGDVKLVLSGPGLRGKCGWMLLSEGA